MKRKNLIGFAAIITLLVISVQTSISIPKKTKEPVFSDLTVTTSSTHLLLFGMLENGFTDEMIQGLHSGLPIHFSFFIRNKMMFSATCASQYQYG